MAEKKSYFRNLTEALFGFEFNEKKREVQDDKVAKFSYPEADGSYLISSGHASYSIAFDNIAGTEFELINFYRAMAINAKVDMAIEEICNESIVNDEVNMPVEINLDMVEGVSAGTKKKIEKEFKYILGLLDFNTKGYEIFRKWYTDSRIVYHKAINLDKPKDGIQDLLQLDPRKVIKIKEIDHKDGPEGMAIPSVVDEYYLYYSAPVPYDSASKFGLTNTAQVDKMMAQNYRQHALKIHKDTLTYVHSGLIDPSSNIIYGHLQKAVKPFNALNQLEDSIIIYRIVRAAEKRVFYVDTGNLPPIKAAEYIKSIQAQYKNKVVYNAVTGEIKTDRKYVAMQEDIWLPRREGSRGTEIGSIPAGENLSSIEDILYFREELYGALNVPSSRFKEDGPSVILGKQSEISREELKFSKFITRLRTQFNELFNDILKTQLMLKEICNEEEWEEIKEKIQYKYLQDSYFAEAKQSELLKERVETADALKEMVGKYFSHEYIMKEILKLSDDQIKQMDEQIKKEMKDPRFTDNAVGGEFTGWPGAERPDDENGGGLEGATPKSTTISTKYDYDSEEETSSNEDDQ